MEIKYKNIPFPKIEGCEFYLCGGAVRDLIKGENPKDLDYVVITDYNFDELVELIKKMGGDIFMTKPEFLIIRFRLNGEIYDIAYPRLDGPYSDGRRPDYVKEVDSLEEDSNRRDLTINAMYLDLNGKIYDFHNGIDDLNNGIIRCVGNPKERFEEDFLRIMRVIRFACRFNFKIEEQTYYDMIKYCKYIKNVAVERIVIELEKSLCHNFFGTVNYINEFKFNIIDYLSDNGYHIKISNKN